MGLIKDIYSPAFYDKFGKTLTQTIPGFDKKKFVSLIFDKEFKNREWKDRMKHTTQVLHVFMPKKFNEAARLIEKTIEALRRNGINGGLEYMFFPDYVETHGVNDLKTSIRAFTFITPFISCEFAVRPFILKYPDEMMGQMLVWSQHKNEHVRRLSSEGCRPRLPWAMALPALKKNPAAIIPVLENLKNDPSEYVRRSVANNLNDIAKDNPEILLTIARKWKGKSKETDAIIKHGCRTLLKQAHPAVLKIYGLDSSKITVGHFGVDTPKVKTGDYMTFRFSVKNEGQKKQHVRLEYGIYYKKAKGHLAKKVFKISEKMLAPGEHLNIQRRQSFKPITTRVFHAGEHQVSVIVNGEEKQTGKFILLA